VTAEDALDLSLAAAEAPHRLALVSTTERLTYAELSARVARRARTLRAPVSIAPTLDVDTMVTLLAAVAARAPLVLLHPRGTAEDHATRRALIERATLPPDTLALLFTSGTTGVPKVALLPRTSVAAALGASAERLGWQPEDRWGLLLPPAHIGGLSVLLRCVQGRATTVLGASPFDAPAAIDQVERERITLLSVVPTMLAHLLDAGWRPPAHLRAVLVGGAALPPELHRRALAAGVPVHATYGMTETCAQMATAAPDEPGVGRPLPGVQLRIDEGQIRVRGPSLFAGYLGRPSPFDADGFFPTGDAGYLDDAGYLHVTGRLDDRIVTGGENVDPAVVEAALEAHPALVEAAVFGAPDPVWGQVVSAFVVSSLPDDALRETVAQVAANLAAHERPRRVLRVDAVPRTPSGKKQRRADAADGRLLSLEAEPR